MAKKIVTLFLLFAFFLFNMSCAPLQVKGPSEIAGANSRTAVISVITKSGDRVEFRKSDPGRIVHESRTIVGTALQDIEIDAAGIKNLFKNEKGQVLRVVMRDGSVYEVKSFAEEGDKRRISAYAPITIPFSDIHQVWIRKVDSLSITPMTGVWLIVGLAAVSVLGRLVFWSILKAGGGDEEAASGRRSCSRRRP